MLADGPTWGRCHGLDLAPLNAGSTINRRALWHRGYQGKGATRLIIHAAMRSALPDLLVTDDGP